MKATFVSYGDRVDYTPTADVAAGDVVVQGDLIGIAASPIAANTHGALGVVGVFDVVKASATVFAAGAQVYWDATNQVAVTTSEGNKLLGLAVRAAGNGETLVRVRIG